MQIYLKQGSIQTTLYILLIFCELAILGTWNTAYLKKSFTTPRLNPARKKRFIYLLHHP